MAKITVAMLTGNLRGSILGSSCTLDILRCIVVTKCLVPKKANSQLFFGKFRPGSFILQASTLLSSNTNGFGLITLLIVVRSSSSITRRASSSRGRSSSWSYENRTHSSIVAVADRGKICNGLARDLEHHAGCMLLLLLLSLQR
jgi:hypothetical protein